MTTTSFIAVNIIINPILTKNLLCKSGKDIAIN